MEEKKKKIFLKQPSVKINVVVSNNHTLSPDPPPVASVPGGSRSPPGDDSEMFFLDVTATASIQKG
jgi:hypothetical protein